MASAEYDELIKQYELINNLILDEIENLKYLLDNTLISNINLMNIHYSISDLIIKRDNIKTEVYNISGEILTDEI